MVTNHGNEILSSQFSTMRGSNAAASNYNPQAHLQFKSGGPIRAFDSGIYMGSRGGGGTNATDFHGASRKQTQT